MSINPTGACDVTAPLMARSDPVADLCGDPESDRPLEQAAQQVVAFGSRAADAADILAAGEAEDLAGV